MYAVDELNQLEDLSECRLLWRALHARTRRASFFQTREWLECYWRHYGAGQQLRVLVVKMGGQPTGILPLVVKSERTRLGAVRVLTNPLDGWGAFSGPVGPQPTQTLRGALRHLQDSPRDWDLLDLRDLDSRSADYSRAASALQRARYAYADRPWEQAAEVSFERLDAGRQFLLQRRLRDAERRLWRVGRWEVVRHRPAGLGAGAADVCRELWRLGAPLNSPFDPRDASYLQDLYDTAGRAGALDWNLLLLNGAPAGWILGVRGDESVEPAAAAFDPRWAQEAQAVLVGRMLCEGAARGDRRYVFGPRLRSLADGWEADAVVSRRLTHFAPLGMRAQLLRWAQWRKSSARLSPPAAVGA